MCLVTTCYLVIWVTWTLCDELKVSGALVNKICEWKGNL